jgi:cytochrome P450
VTEHPAGDPPTVDVDHHSDDFHRDRHARWAELRGCPVAWNTRYGGFWMVGGYDEVTTVARDAETFSSRHRRVPRDRAAATDGRPAGDIDFIGIAGIPRSRAVPTAGIAEVEGSIHAALRRALNPYLVPPAVARLRPSMEALTTWFLDERIESGTIDLVTDLANPVPAVVTLQLVGLPAANWGPYAELFHGMIAHEPGSSELQRALASLPSLMTELRSEVADRRRSPRDDLLTDLVELELDDGRRLDDDELVAVLWNLIGGGLDTTTSLTALTLLHLDEHRGLRRRLVDEPDLLPTATDEYLRYFSVNETLTRTVTRDVDLGGQQLRRGDHLMLSWLSANRDGAVFDEADEVVVDRGFNPHLAFGVGPHRCIGMHLARALFQVLVRAVLTRLPDYAVDRRATRHYATNPELAGIVSMPATFTPGPRTGPAEPPF